jgi:2-phospho-L-lactate guanylyltransferase
MIARRIAAVIPVKERTKAKQRLREALRPALRRQLAKIMFADVLACVAATPGLAVIRVITVDPEAAEIARSHGAEICEEGADEGHSAAVAAAARALAKEGLDMLTLPADIPLVQQEDIARLLNLREEGAHIHCRRFLIVPARDERGSNAVLCSPADVVPLRFGSDSFFPHLAQSRAYGIEPVVVRLPRIALDIDTPEDLAILLAAEGHTRTQALLTRWHDRGSLTIPDTAARHTARHSSG